jgi:hypothetical protein
MKKYHSFSFLNQLSDTTPQIFDLSYQPKDISGPVRP